MCESVPQLCYIFDQIKAPSRAIIIHFLKKLFFYIYIALLKGGGSAEDSEAGGSQQHHRQAEGDRTQYFRPRRQSWPRIQVFH
jgi:hypothetical protein